MNTYKDFDSDCCFSEEKQHPHNAQAHNVCRRKFCIGIGKVRGDHDARGETMNKLA